MITCEEIPAWVSQGVCGQVDPELFFPGEKGGDTRPAKSLCLACSVRVDCLEYALEKGEVWGVWGGKSPRERRAIKLSRAKAAPVGSEVAA